jgi:general secretion pathway protein H
MIAHSRMTRRVTKGFTLIEILIVILIISIVSGVALVTFSGNKNKQLETLAKQLTYLIIHAESEAILQPQTLGLALSHDHFQFYHYTSSSLEDNAWQAITTKNLGLHKIPEYIQISLQVNHETKPLDGKPHIIISESGDMTPFRITIAKVGSKPSYIVRGEANGEVKTEVYHEE